ncbi:S24 family peptidase [Desulfovibrio subterraneus]|uniref:Transcriptional regulator n=1 Tax=Desulfovibrio subterraneus TaxID=2718620 RepID=A0A7J0BKF2_9BACT|nr:S24 family peptidase [Desulfovibrio subterraneus]GFM34058.1 transcriptional regulator [Desulfovibrio subterraneus]
MSDRYAQISSLAWAQILDRLKALRDSGETYQAIGRRMGVQRGSVQNWIDGLRSGERVSFADMLRYLDSLQIPIDSILKGLPTEVPPLKNTQIKNLRPNAQADPAFIMSGEAPLNSIGAVVNVYATAGAGLALDNQTDTPLAQISIPAKYVRPSLLVVIVEGDSMEPTIKKGAYVGIDHSAEKLIQGEVYGVNLPYEGVVLKRVYFDHSSDSLVLKSDNQKHSDIRLPIENREGLIIGKAIWVMQDL